VYEYYRSGHVGKCCNLVLGCLKYMPQPVYTVRLGEEIGNRDIGNNEESPEAQRQLGLVGKPEELACRSCSG
jgi:hypothetical protein